MERRSRLVPCESALLEIDRRCSCNSDHVHHDTLRLLTLESTRKWLDRQMESKSAVDVSHASRLSQLVFSARVCYCRVSTLASVASLVSVAILISHDSRLLLRSFITSTNRRSCDLQSCWLRRRLDTAVSVLWRLIRKSTRSCLKTM